jgi:hypothetical protein
MKKKWKDNIKRLINNIKRNLIFDKNNKLGTTNNLFTCSLRPDSGRFTIMSSWSFETKGNAILG